ncbi:hypothetical protein Tco_0315374, partial [Tanacetum coccineum]
MDLEHGSEKMKSPKKMKSVEKMEEEDVATQKREEVPIEVESLSTKFPIVDWKTGDAEWYSHTYADREEIPSKSRDDVQDVEEEIR